MYMYPTTKQPGERFAGPINFHGIGQSPVNCMEIILYSSVFFSRNVVWEGGGGGGGGVWGENSCVGREVVKSIELAA